jgi:hypothetical protein
MESRSWFREAFEERIVERAHLILAPYFDVLEREPDPSWSDRELQRFRQFQVEVAELILNRLEGVPSGQSV